MLYVFKDDVFNGKYIGGEREPSDKTQCRAYRYVTSLKHAKFFDSVKEAINWLERVAYKSGEDKASFNGCLQLIRVESVPEQFKEVGPAK